MSSPTATPDREHLFQQVTQLALSEAGALLSASVPGEAGFHLQGCRHGDWDSLFDTLPAEHDLLCVAQSLRPAERGTMLWFCTEGDARDLLHHLLGEEIRLEVLTEMEEEALTEIGNRIINRCLEHHGQLTTGIDGAAPPRLWRERPGALSTALPRPADSSLATLAELRIEHSGRGDRAWLLWCGAPWQAIKTPAVHGRVS